MIYKKYRSRIRSRKIKKLKKKNKSLRKKTYSKKSRKELKGGADLGELEISDIIQIVNEYSTIYIAIGAKYQPNSYPIKINTGPNQLIPDFIWKDDVSRQLIIIIDEFNAEQLDFNKNYVHESLVDRRENIDYVFINSLYNTHIQDQIIELVTNLTSDQNIYICNYVYYFAPTPNPSEVSERNKVENLLKDLRLGLFKNKYGDILPKNKNIYKWLGAIEPNYICELTPAGTPMIMPFEITTVINSIKRMIDRGLAPKENHIEKVREFINQNCLRITSEYSGESILDA